MKMALLVIVFISCCTNLFAQDARIWGRVTDKQTSDPLVGATVTVMGTTRATLTNREGRFTIQNPTENSLTLRVSHIGYEPYEITVHRGDQKGSIAIALHLSNLLGNEVVISASKRPEKITNAPASISVITRGEIEQFAGSNVIELVSYLPSVEFGRSGVDQVHLNARGFNNAFNNKVFQLVDHRNSMHVSSPGLPLRNNGTMVKEDLERVEVFLGPQAALYGPNSLNAILHFITKDPRKYEGTTVSLSAGNQAQFSGRFRQAAKINGKLAYKLTGEYAAGREFEFYDSVRVGGRNFGLDTIWIPERNVDFDFGHLRGEGHVYYSVFPKSDIIISVGGSENHFLQMTTSGRNQVRGHRSSFLQARFVSKNFFLNAYNSWGTLGSSFGLNLYTRDFYNRAYSKFTDTTHLGFQKFGRLLPHEAEKFALRTMVKDQNQRFNAEAQYNYHFEKEGVFLVTGLSLQEDKPNTFGTQLGDSINRIYIKQIGGVLQLEKSLPRKTRLVAAARLDNHSLLGTYLSPRFGLLKQLGEGTIRLTWGRSYSMPSIIFQSFNNGNFFGNGEGIIYIPNGSKIEDPSAIKMTPPLKAEQVNTWETGYRGRVGKQLYIDGSFYYGHHVNFISPALIVRGRALAMGFKPVTPSNGGQVMPDGTLEGASFSTWLNYGKVAIYGTDVSVRYSFNSHINLAIKYSWFDSDITKKDLKNDANRDSCLSAEETSINTARHRGGIIVNFQNLFKKKVFINLAARLVEQYDFYSGSQIGTRLGKGKPGFVELCKNQKPLLKNMDFGALGGFASVELGAGAKVNDMTTVSMRITNLFNSVQREFVGSPSIGRLYLLELRVHVPPGRK